jgi:hypothetical protein
MQKKLLIIFIIFILIIFFLGCVENQNGNNKDDESLNNKLSLFDYPPVDLDKVEFIEPLGLMIGAHVTPIDHQYYVASDFSSGQNIVIDVISPGDGIITGIQHMGSFDGTMDDYRFVIQHNETISSVYIHVDKLSDKIALEAPGFSGYKSVNIMVIAGEIIGNYSGSVDYNIVDNNVVLPGFVDPDSYVSEDWKTHIPDPFDYFNESIRDIMIEKCLRNVEPFGGKIDYDIDGRLIGNWFLKDTNGYGGLNVKDYWDGHLAIAYNAIDPYTIIVSIGNFTDEPMQFAVKENSPDPADVSVESGLVKYELVGYDYYDEDKHWDRSSLVKGLKIINDEYVRATVLFQLVDDRELKMEVFYNQTADMIDGFTNNALIFIR